jgi:hypothetical protein
MRRFDSAPWPTLLKVTSAVATALLAGAGYAVVRAIPRGTRVPFAETFGTLIAFVPPLIALVALLYVVRGYELRPAELLIRRLLWTTSIPLDGLARAWHDPEVMRRSLRVWGNGGLYGFTGVYQNAALGRYRAFVTDPHRAVVLELPRKKVVISPADPAPFLEGLAALFPQVRIGGPGGQR